MRGFQFMRGRKEEQRFHGKFGLTREDGRIMRRWLCWRWDSVRYLSFVLVCLAPGSIGSISTVCFQIISGSGFMKQKISFQIMHGIWERGRIFIPYLIMDCSALLFCYLTFCHLFQWIVTSWVAVFFPMWHLSC